MIILDCGSGNSCLNNIDKACAMVKAVYDLAIPDSYIKWQLFKKAGNNISLSHEVFERAVRYAEVLHVKTGVSVFDKESLDFALKYGMYFIKLANNKDSQALLKDVPDYMRVIYSTNDPDFKTDRKNTDVIYCVSKYPASDKDYDKFGDKLKQGISDHTTSFALYKKYNPKIYEVHMCLERVKTNPDSGTFSRLPEQLKELV